MLWWSSLCTNKRRIDLSDTPVEVTEEGEVLLEKKEKEEEQNKVKKVQGEGKNEELKEKELTVWSWRYFKGRN